VITCAEYPDIHSGRFHFQQRSDLIGTQVRFVSKKDRLLKPFWQLPYCIANCSAEFVKFHRQKPFIYGRWRFDVRNVVHDYASTCSLPADAPQAEYSLFFNNRQTSPTITVVRETWIDCGSTLTAASICASLNQLAAHHHCGGYLGALSTALCIACE
jgi:hypothetical protein